MPKNIGIPLGMDRRVDDALLEWQKTHGQNNFTVVKGTTDDGRSKLMNIPDAVFDFLLNKGIDITHEI